VGDVLRSETFTGKNLPEGLAMIEKAKAAGAKTQRERDYIAALELFYKDHDTRDHTMRVAAYEQAMGVLAAHYPDDLEASVKEDSHARK
jgi:hypothetical protein